MFAHELQHQLSRNSQITDDLIKARAELRELKEHCRMVKELGPQLAEQSQREYIEWCEKDIADDTAGKRGKGKDHGKRGKGKDHGKDVELGVIEQLVAGMTFTELMEEGRPRRGGSKLAVNSDDEDEVIAGKVEVEDHGKSGKAYRDFFVGRGRSRDNVPSVSGSSGDIQVFVKGLSGETFSVFAPPSTSIAVFKQVVEQKTHVPVNLQRIFFAGAQLLTGTLASHNVQHESTVHLGGPIAGGGKRARVALAEIRQRDDDPPLIKAVFEVKEFEVQSFLQAMTSDEVSAYYDLLKQYRSIDRQIAITVAEIPAMKALEDLRFYLVYKGTG
jgi:hypothetical protein